MLSYDHAAAKKQWREAVRAVAEAIEDAGGVVDNVNDAKLDTVEAWIGESRRWLLDGLRPVYIDAERSTSLAGGSDAPIPLPAVGSRMSSIADPRLSIEPR